MKVAEKITFKEYSSNNKYSRRIPKLHSLKILERLGDNIYHPLITNPVFADDYEIIPNDYHGENEKVKDLSGLYVLIARQYYYFGSKPLIIPDNIRPVLPIGQSSGGSRTYDESRALAFIIFVENKFKIGIHSRPHKWFDNDSSWKNDENYIES